MANGQQYQIRVDLIARLQGLQQGLKEAEKQIDGWVKNTREKFKAFEEGAVAMGAAAAGLGLALGSATKAYADFESKLNGVRAVSNATGEQLDQIKKKAMQLGADTQFSASQAADGFFELGKAGFTVAEQMDSIEGTISLAAAAGIRIGEAAETSSGILRGFGLAAGEAGKVADQLAQAANSSAVDVSDLSLSMKYIAPVARASNQSLSEMMGVLAVLGNNMIKSDMAGTTMRSAISSLQKPTKDAAAIMQDLGIATQDTQGKMLPFSEIVNNMRSRMAGLTENQRASNVATIFGESAMSGMLALINQAPGSIEKMIAAQDNASGAAKTMADTMNQGINFQLEQLKGSIETLWIQIGNDLAPAVGKINTALTNFVNAAGSVPDPVRQVATAIAALTLALTALAATIGGLSLALPTIANGFKVLGAAVGITSTSLIAFRNAALAPMAATIIFLNANPLALMATLIAAIGTAAVLAVPKVIELINAIRDLDLAHRESAIRMKKDLEATAKAVDRALILWDKYRKGIKLTKEEAKDAVVGFRLQASMSEDPAWRKAAFDKANELQKKYLPRAAKASGGSSGGGSGGGGKGGNTTVPTVSTDPNQAKIQAAQEALRIAMLEADVYKKGDASRTQALTDYIGKLKGIPGTYALILEAMRQQQQLGKETGDEYEGWRKEIAQNKQETQDNLDSSELSRLGLESQKRILEEGIQKLEEAQAPAKEILELRRQLDAVEGRIADKTGQSTSNLEQGAGLNYFDAGMTALSVGGNLAAGAIRDGGAPSAGDMARGGASVVGALVGGPLGMAIGSAAGGIIGAWFDKNDEAAEKQKQAAEEQKKAAEDQKKAAFELKRTQYEEGMISPEEWITELLKQAKGKMITSGPNGGWNWNTQEGIKWQKDMNAAQEALRLKRDGGHALTGDDLARAQNDAGILSDQSLLDILTRTFNKEKGDHGESWATTTEEGISLGQELRNLADKIKDGMKDALGQFSQFNPLPVKDYSIQQLFAAGPQQRFFVESAGRVDVNLRIDGKVDKAAIMSLQNDPDVKGMFANMANQGNAAMRLVPGQ